MGGGGGSGALWKIPLFFNPSLMVEEKLHNNLGEDLFYSVKHPFEQKLYSGLRKGFVSELLGLLPLDNLHLLSEKLAQALVL